MDRLSELLGIEVDLAALSSEDLATRRTDLTEAARAAREGDLTAETAELIKTAAAQVSEIRTEESARAEAAAQIIKDADDAIALLGDDDAEGEEGDSDESGEGEAEEAAPADEPAEETPADAPAEAAAEPVAEPIAAGAKPAKRAPLRKDITVPGSHRPRANRRNGPVMIATGEAKGFAAGHLFANSDEMNRAIHEKWVSMRGTPDGVPHHVASIDWGNQYGPDRTIDGGDAFQVSNQLMGYLADRDRGFREQADAFVASGGVPGPSEPRYDVTVYGQADRPIVAGLPTVKLKRGSTIYNTSPVLGAVLLDTALGALGTVTAASDLAGATKNVQEITAPVQQTATVEAETLRWSQGNFADRFLPEWTAAFMRLGLTAFARHNDALRLADIKTKSTKYTDSVAHFGAFRDLKRQFMGEAEMLRDVMRDYDQPIRVIFPEFVAAQCAADLIAQAPGDEAYLVTKASVRRDIEAWDPRINITWAKDSIRGRLSTTPSGQSPRSPGYDADVEWAMFPEGAFVYGDGGALDLGILRDTVVSATNKFQTFFEQWECLFQLVDPTLCFWNTSSLCANGVSQAAASVTGTCEPQGS